jgi:hypothetical protein
MISRLMIWRSQVRAPPVSSEHKRKYPWPAVTQRRGAPHRSPAYAVAHAKLAGPGTPAQPRAVPHAVGRSSSWRAAPVREQGEGGPAHRVKTVITTKAPTARTMTCTPFAMAARSHHRCRSPRARAQEPGTRSGREHQRLRRCTHPACLGSWAEPLARRVVTTRDGVAQLKRDALRLTSNGHGRDVSSVVCTGSPPSPS